MDDASIGKKINLEAGEEIVTSVNDHWVVLIRPAIVHAIGFLFGALLVAISFSLEDFQRTQIILFVAGWTLTLIIFHLLFAYLLSWELSSVIVTTKRIIDMHAVPYVRHDISFINIREIHEIEKKKHGIWQNLLHYGNVEINLAARPDTICIEHVPHSTDFVNLVHAIYKTGESESIDRERLKELYPY